MIKLFLLSYVSEINSYSYRVIEITSDCVQTQISRTYSSPNTTYVKVCVLPDLTNINAANSPINLIETLKSRVNEIRTFIPRLAGDLIDPQALPPELPGWTGTPQWLSADTGSIAITVILIDSLY